ncbi:C-Jun-amino-terminal kinase-interacting protein 4-like isoform X2 [Hypanus sabinus]|uniref:C-Jun-amino-terminal kinase-interacting protein 4-like isoform X2 n=1 Tax=Hypanus sabinus TaxID=79690 RepID=UPI0028C4F2BF|nr:C-Jun-amino-terminal kinase-interacting protein 4-like isoform X2 [Hypanus sabinus]
MSPAIHSFSASYHLVPLHQVISHPHSPQRAKPPTRPFLFRHAVQFRWHLAMSGDPPPPEGFDDLVSGLAAGLYAELRRLVSLYGESSVSSLVPLAISTLESLQDVCAQGKEQQAELGSAQQEAQLALAQLQSERDRRKEAEQRFLELEDSFDQDRMSLKRQMESALTQYRQMEVKARSCSDTILQLEEEKRAIEKEYQRLQQKHKAALRTVGELRYQIQLEASRCPMPTSPNVKRRGKSSREESELSGQDQGYSESGPSEEEVTPSAETPATPATPSLPQESSHLSLSPSVCPHSPALTSFNSTFQESVRATSQVIEEILNSTPELHSQCEEEEEPVTSTPDHAQDPEADRNTSSILEELQTLGSQFIDELDSGANISDARMASVVSENEELREKQVVLESARRSLLARVEELVHTRTELQEEMRRLQEHSSAQELRVGQLGAALSRAEAMNKSQGQEDHSQTGCFTRAEMSRVLTERNLYKERLMDLQEALHRSQQVRVMREQQAQSPSGRSTLWDRFHRLLGLSQKRDDLPLEPARPALMPPSLELMPRQRRGRTMGVEVINPLSDPYREQQRESWRQTRSYIWEHHGRAQIQGWSLPMQDIIEGHQAAGLQTPIGPSPSLIHVRLLDQRNPGFKLSCAAPVHLFGPLLEQNQRASAETRPKLGHLPHCSLWICAGGPAGAEVTVVDPLRANRSLAAFSLPHHCLLCVACVPAHASLDDRQEAPGGDGSQNSQLQESPGGGDTGQLATVWLGTQSGWVFVHSADPPDRCLYSTQLKDAVHSIIYVRGFVIITLANGTISIFKRSTEGLWDTTAAHTLDLGPPRHPVLCAVAVFGRVWCGYRNRIYVINPRVSKIERWFEVTPEEAQVQQLSRSGEGVWVSMRNDSHLRLLHSHSGEILQEVELEPLIRHMFGPAPLRPDDHLITTLLGHRNRLWIGTAGGTILSLPLSDERESEPITPVSNGTASGPEVPLNGKGSHQQPTFCQSSQAQICFHGHKGPVQFLVAISGSLKPVDGPRDVLTQTQSGEGSTSLILSGGEGYINFRIGDDTSASETGSRLLKSDRSHLIVSGIGT